MNRPCLVVERPGLFSTLQDLGRFGYQRFGISASGAMDGIALQAANVLVGNPPGTAAIEITLVGPMLKVADAPCNVAVAGADMPLSINGTRVEPWCTLALQPGDAIEIGAARAGMYAYLAVAGGFDLPTTLGSLSTHSRSGLGGFSGRALAAGDSLPVGEAGACPPLLLQPSALPSRSGPIRVVLGPQEDAFAADGLATFLGSEYRITNKADRMGVQLDGPSIRHANGFNIVSDGIVNGSIQVPGTGRPLVLLADRQTTGGYPKIATIIGPDLPLMAQRRPGETVRFVQVSPLEAEAAAHEHRRALASMLRSCVPVMDGSPTLTAEALLAANLVSGVWAGFDREGMEWP